MARWLALAAAFVCLAGCATGASREPSWYLVSPVATVTYPRGDLNSPMSTWERVKDYPSGSDCQRALQATHNDIHRPVACIASNDPRLQQ